MSCARNLGVTTALILALAMAALPVQGQVLEDPVTVPVRFVVTTGLIGYNPALNVWAGGGGTAAFSIADTGDYLHAEQPQYGPANFSKLANMAPSRTYTLSMTAMNVHEHFRVYIAAPTGYRVFINEVEQYGLNFTAAPANWVSVPSSASVRVENGEGAGPGVASSLRPSRVVWSVGLGDLKNGDAAGVISLRQANHTAFSAADFQTSSLIYSAPSAEVQVRYGTGSASGSFQVYATQCLAQVNPLTGGPQGFTIKFYDPSQVTATIVNNQWQMQQGAVAFQEFQVENSTPFAWFFRLSSG